MELVINCCYGGFGLSDEACERLGCERYDYQDEEERCAPELVECVRELGELANGSYADLEIVELPEEVTDWEIDEYDGFESVIYVVDGKIHHA